MMGEMKSFYGRLGKVQEFRISTPEDSIFRLKRGLPVAVCENSLDFDIVPHIEDLYGFLNNNSTFWVVPSDLSDGTIIGFVLRGVDKKEYRVIRQRTSPGLLFGFQAFEKYKGEPIIFVEGVKDAIYLQQFYPYVLSVQTSGFSSELYAIVCTLTKSVILGFDSDSAGEKSSEEAKEVLLKRGVKSERMVPLKKDFGEYKLNKEFDEIAREQIRRVLFKFRKG